MSIANIKPKNIAIVYFPTDGGRWTDQIVSSFSQSLSFTKMPFIFTSIGWSAGQSEDEVVRKVAESMPDLVFLPDDQLYRRFAKRIHDKSGAFTLITSFQYRFADLNELPDNKQAGVFCEHPIDNLLLQARRLQKVESLGVVGGPFAGEILSRIREKIGDKLHLEAHLTDKWDDYVQKAREYEERLDAVWVLAAFGVKDHEGNWVGDHKIEALLSSLNKMTLGYGRVSGITRTIEMNIDPKDLGKNAAAIAFRHFRGERVGLESFTSYSLKISELGLKKLNLKIPDEMAEFVVP